MAAPGYAPTPYPPQQQPYPPNPGQQGYAAPGPYGSNGNYGHQSPQGSQNPLPKKKKRKAPWIISGVLVLLLIAAGAGYFVFASASKKQDDLYEKGGGGNLPTATLKQVWATGNANGNLVGVWQTAHGVVRIGQDGIDGYDLATGKKLFSVAPPKAGLKPCSASATLAPGDIGSIFYSEDGNFDCDTVIGVNADTGKQLWNLHSSDKVTDTATGSTFIDGSIAVIASDSDAVAGVDAATGNEVWKYTSTTKGCAPANIAGMGAVVIVQENCTANGAVGKGDYVAVDAATGKHLWQTPTAQDYGLRAVVSTNPVVLLVASSKSTVNGLEMKDGAEFLTFDSAGKQTSNIPADPLQIGSFLRSPYPHAIVHGTTLYAEVTGPKKGVAIGAFDLTTGARVWTYQATFGTNYEMDVFPLGFAPDASPLVVVNLKIIGNASPLEKLDPATSKATQVSVLPDSAEPEDSLLLATPNGGYILAPENPKDGPALTVVAPK
jgi:outer membrane protein assembly factor BamB